MSHPRVKTLSLSKEPTSTNLGCSLATAGRNPPAGASWPAAGSVDTEIGCFREPEASDAEAQVQSRVQDRGGPLCG
jgi:hypothetical protein